MFGYCDKQSEPGGFFMSGLSEYVSDYLTALRYEQGAAVTTGRQYQAALRRFVRWLTETGYPSPTVSEFNPTLLRRFLYYLQSQSLRPRSIRGYFHALRGLGEFLTVHGLIPQNHAKSISMPKKDAAIRETISNEEVAAMLEACERIHNPRRRALCRAVLGVLIFGGLRRIEVCELRLDDVKVLEGGECSVHIRQGKGQKSRTIFLEGEPVAALRLWIEQRFPDCIHDYLFAVDKRRRLFYHAIASVVEEVKAIAGFEGRDNIKPHSMRHWRATDLMRAGTNLKDVQDFLGHSSLITTAIYTHGSEAQQRQLAKATTLKRADNPAVPPAPAPEANVRSRRREIRRL